MRQKRARNQKEKNEKQRKILDTARELFLLHGYKKTSIRLIMRHARMSLGTFYLYFNNKTEVYKTLMFEGFTIWEEDFYRAIKSSHDPEEQVKAILRAYYNFLFSNPQYADIISFISATEEELREQQSEIGRLMIRRNNQLLANIRQVIIRGNNQKKFFVNDPWTAAHIFWGWLDGLLLLYRRRALASSRIDIKKAFEEQEKLILASLKNSP